MEILERIKSDLNELIDVRGNKHVIPTLVQVQGYLDELTALKSVMCSLIAIDECNDDDVYDENLFE